MRLITQLVDLDFIKILSWCRIHRIGQVPGTLAIDIKRVLDDVHLTGVSG
jgi:hypothetical protein